MRKESGFMRVVPDMAAGAWSARIGGRPAACLFAIGVCVASGKDGIAYHQDANLAEQLLAILPIQDQLRETCRRAGVVDNEPRSGGSCPTDPRTLNFSLGVTLPT